MRGRQEGGELDDLRIEVLRQKAYVDRELKNQADMYEERHAVLLKVLQDRELEMVAMRATIQALGRKVEEITRYIAETKHGGDRRRSLDGRCSSERRLSGSFDNHPASPASHLKKSSDTLNSRSLMVEAARRQIPNSPASQRMPRPPNTPSLHSSTNSVRAASPNPRVQSPAPRGQSPAPRGQSPVPRGHSPASRPASPGSRYLPSGHRNSPARPRDSSVERGPLFASQDDSETRRSITGQRGHPPFMNGPVFGPAGSEEANLKPVPAPDLELQLHHVFGYHGRDTKGTLMYNPKGDRLVYFSAAVGVIHDKSKDRQQFYRGHTSEIICMAAHPTVGIVATGQAGKDGFVHVWDVQTLGSRAVLRDPQDRGACALSFTASGQHLAVIGTDPFHTLLLFRWETQELIAECRVHAEEVHVAACNPFNERQLVTCGRNWIKFWDIDFDVPKPRINGKNGIIGKRGKAQRLFCISFLDKDNCVTGTEGGELYFWCGSLLVHAVAKVHKGPVFSLCSTGVSGVDESGLAGNVSPDAAASDDSCLSAIQYGMISAGRDGKVLFWNVTDLQQQRRNIASSPTLTLDILDTVPIPAPVRMVRPAPLAGARGKEFPLKVAVGLANNSVWEVNVDGSGATVIVQGAGSAEVTAIATHPTSLMFASVTEDKMVRVWDATTSSLVHSALLPHKSKCLAYSPDGTMLAVGLTGHQLVVFNSADLQLIFSTPITNAPATESRKSTSIQGGNGEYIAMAFSPDQALLAISSVERGLEILDVTHGFRCIGRGKGTTATITNLDWSDDGKVIQTDDTHYEHLFFEWDGALIPRPLSVRSVQWYTWTCRLGWPVQGIWPANAEPTDVLAAIRSYGQDVCCVGAADGEVKVFQWPAPTPQAAYKSFKGHGLPVTQVRFTARDEYAISIGGTNIFSWKVLRPNR